MMAGKKRQIIFISAAVLLLFILFIFGWDAKHFSEPKDDEVAVYFIDTGQSDAVLIKQRENAVLVDTGDVDNQGEIVSFLHSKDVKRLDALVISHPHSDHIGSAMAVLDNFSVKQLYMPEISYTLEDDTVFVAETLKLASEKGVAFTPAKRGTEFKIGEMDFRIISPDRKYDAVNDYSLVVRMEYKGKSFLFCGDIEENAQNDIYESEEMISSDVIKMPHHGAYNEGIEDFIFKIQPRYAVITVGSENTYGHPNVNTLMALKDLKTDVYRTDRHGTVVIFCDGVNFTVETERDYDV